MSDSGHKATGRSFRTTLAAINRASAGENIIYVVSSRELKAIFGQILLVLKTFNIDHKIRYSDRYVKFPNDKILKLMVYDYRMVYESVIGMIDIDIIFDHHVAKTNNVFKLIELVESRPKSKKIV